MHDSIAMRPARTWVEPNQVSGLADHHRRSHEKGRMEGSAKRPLIADQNETLTAIAIPGWRLLYM